MAVADATQNGRWAERLRQVREDRGLTRSQLATLVGMSTTTIWRMEGGKTQTSTVVRNRIVFALGYPDEETFLRSAAGSGKVNTVVEAIHGARVRGLTGRAHGTSNVVGRLDDLRTSEARLLPVYQWGACGDPREVNSAPDPIDRVYAPLGAERLVGPQGFGVLVRGDSMTNRSVLDGDRVWVNPELPPRLGRMVLARIWDHEDYEQGMVVKIWRDGEGFPRLWSDGAEDTGPVACGRFEVIGPVVWIEPAGFTPDQPRRWRNGPSAA